jgi:hypothetical protein
LRALTLLLAVLCLVPACAGRQQPDPKRAQLRTLIEPATATVQVDEQFVGAARVLAKRPARFHEGKHRVTIEAPGYFPHDLELELAAGVTKLEVKLRPVPR